MQIEKQIEQEMQPIPAPLGSEQKIIEEENAIQQEQKAEKEIKEEKEENEAKQNKELEQKESDNNKEEHSEQVKLYVWGSYEVDQYDPGSANCFEGSCRSGVQIPVSHLLQGKEQIKSVHCGALHTMLLTSYGRVFSFGCNDDGVLGREGNESTPGLVDLPVRVDLLSTGDSHCVCASSQHNRLFHWGVFRSTNGNMKTPDRTYKEMEWNKKGIMQIVSGSNHCLIHTLKGKVYVCGDPDCLVLGRIPGQRRRFQQALAFEGMNLRSVENVWSGGNHAFVRIVKAKKGKLVVKIKAWGSNNYGQLGTKDQSEQIRIPQDIVGIDHSRVKCMGGGEHHSLAVLDDGSVWTWGRNDEGELGAEIPSEENAAKAKFAREPMRVQALDKVKVEECVVGPTFNFVIAGKGKREEQQVYSWGNGDMYILANGKEENERVPYQVKNAFFKKMPLMQIDLGSQHAAFLVKQDETIEDPEFDDEQLRIVQKKEEQEQKPKRKYQKQPKKHDQEEEKEQKEEENKVGDQKQEQKEEKVEKKKEKKRSVSKTQKKAQTTKKKLEKQEKGSRKSKAKSLSKEGKKIRNKTKSPGRKSKQIKDKIEEEAKDANKMKKKQGKINKNANNKKRLHDQAFQEEEKTNKDISNPLQKVKD